MASVNKVILVGNVGRDPEVRSFDSGMSKASFSLATSETFKNKDGERTTLTEWHNIVVWGNLTKVVEQFVRKGSQIYIEGKITSRSYESDGVTKYITEIRVNDLVLLGKSQNGDSVQRTESQRSNTPSFTPEPHQEIDMGDELPF